MSTNIALVNDDFISLKEYERHFRDFLYRHHEENPDDELDQFEERNLRIEILNKLIDNVLLYQFGKSKQYLPNEDEINQELNSVLNEFDDKTSFKSSLSSMNITEKELMEDIKKNLTIEKVINEEIAKYITFDEKDLENYYKNNSQFFNLGKAIKVKHIFIKLEDFQTKLEKDKAYTKILTIKNKINSGEKFEKLAKIYSDCPSNIHGGSLGYLTRGELDKDFEDKLFSMDENRISDIIMSVYGYHIAKIEDKIDNYIPEFMKIKSKLKDFMFDYIKEEMLENFLEDLRDNAKIEIYDKIA